MDLLRLGLLGGVLGLDSTAVGQFMVSRPLVAGWLAGWVTGVPEFGITIGAVLEVFLLVSFPTGGARFPEGSTAAVVAVGVAAPYESPDVVAGAVAIGLVWGQFGGWTVTLQRNVNGWLVPRANVAQQGVLARAHAVAVLIDFARGMIVTAAGIWLGRFALGFVGRAWRTDGSISSGVLFVGAVVSLGIMLHDLGGFRRRRILFVAGLALGIVGARFL